MDSSQPSPESPDPWVPPPSASRGNPSKLRVAAAVGIVSVLLFAALGAAIVFGKINVNFNFGARDRDHDGYPDSVDAFPDNPREWKDSDHDGLGDNGDPFPYDYDNDGFPDATDLVQGYDAGLAVALNTTKILDTVGGSTSTQVRFLITVEGNDTVVDDNGRPFSMLVGQGYAPSKVVKVNVPDDRRYVNVSIAMIAVRSISNVFLDIDPSSVADRVLHLRFDLVNCNWTGDDTTGFADGSLDGTQATNDNDAVLRYSLNTCIIESSKVYQWRFEGYSYSLDLNITAQEYYGYKDMAVDRSPLAYAVMAEYVTSSDAVVVDLAQKLLSQAQREGFDDLHTLNFMLAFVQLIGYSYDNASTGQDDYWRYSVETLWDHTGDCEDLAILYASILEATQHDAVLLLFPGHMATGVDCSSASGTYFADGSVDYFYCETTSVGWRVGQVPSEMRGIEAEIIQVS